MRPTASTWILVRKIAAASGLPQFMLLFSLYAEHDGDSVIQSVIRKEARVDTNAQKPFREAMEEIGLISCERKGKQWYVTVLNPDINNINISSSATLIHDSFKDRKEKKRDPDIDIKREHILEDIEQDEDWPGIKETLLKYFKPYQITEKSLSSKNYWDRLNALLMDEDIELDQYAKWYRINKYPKLKFNWGLFLLDTMISEFKDDDEADNYLEVSSNFENDAAFRKLAEEDAKNLAVEIRKRREKKAT